MRGSRRDTSYDAQPVSHAWRSDGISQAERFRAWSQALDESFLPWTLNPVQDAAFNAELRERRFDKYRWISCDCDPFSGYRSTREIANTSQQFLSILFVMSGTEILKIDKRECILRAGDFVLWDSARQMQFAVSGRLQKLTLMVREPELCAVLPGAHDFVGKPVDGRRGTAAVFTQHLLALEREIWTMSEPELDGMLRGTLELFASAVVQHGERDRHDTRFLAAQRVRQYILAHLTEPDLCPESIAEACRISTRYLHLLFADGATTVSEWIRIQRLNRVSQALCDGQQMDRNLTEIAFTWGFKDMSHFGKVFRKHFGVSPSQYRQQRAQENLRG